MTAQAQRIADLRATAAKMGDSEMAARLNAKATAYEAMTVEQYSAEVYRQCSQSNFAQLRRAATEMAANALR